MQSGDKINQYSDEEIKKVWDESTHLRRIKPRWELHRSDDFEFIQEVAKTIGWLDIPQRVQIRRSPEARLDGTFKDYYVIEPYEEDCSCPNIIEPPPAEFNSEPVT